MNERYVYIYLDPMKPGSFIYGEYSYEYEPFYVGLGKGDRKNDHIRETKWVYGPDKRYNKHKYNRIRKIIKNGFLPTIQTPYDNLALDEARRLERLLIQTIGRRNLDTGPLCNLTDGGEGSLNYIVTDATRKRLSETCSGELNGMYGKIPTPETRKKIGDSNRGKKRTDEYKAYVSMINMGEGNPFYGKKHTEETRQKIRENSPVTRGKDNPESKKWIFIDPQGIKYKIVGGFDNFCREHNLSRSLCHRMINKGVIIPKEDKKSTPQTRNCKGWKVVNKHGPIA